MSSEVDFPAPPDRAAGGPSRSLWGPARPTSPGADPHPEAAHPAAPPYVSPPPAAAAPAAVPPAPGLPPSYLGPPAGPPHTPWAPAAGPAPGPPHHPYPPHPGPPPGPGVPHNRRALTIAAAVGAVLLVVAGVVSVVVARSGPATPPVVAAGPAAPATAAPSYSAPPSGSSSPYAGYPTGTSSSSGLVTLVGSAASHPEAYTVLELADRYFSAINVSDYASWSATVVPRRAADQPMATWLQDYRSTIDSDVVITSIEYAGSDAVTVDLSFTSTQDLADAPPDLPVDTICWTTSWPVSELSSGGLVAAPPSGTTTKRAGAC